MSRFEMDHDVERVLLFMQTNIRATKLVAVVRAVSQLAGLIWARYEGDTNDPEDKFKPFGLSMARRGDFTQPESDSLSPPLSTTPRDPLG
jgi:hypothetical protein